MGFAGSGRRWRQTTGDKTRVAPTHVPILLFTVEQTAEIINFQFQYVIVTSVIKFHFVILQDIF